MINTSKIKNDLPLLFFLVILPLSLFRIKSLALAMRRALSVCAESLVPSIFPFLVLTELILHTKAGRRILKVISLPFSFFFRTSREGGAAYLFGILFGFPLGIKALCEYYKAGLIEKKEAEDLLLFSNNTGPAFLIGGVGIGLLGSAQIGTFLYLLQFFVSFIFGMVLGFFRKRNKRTSAAINILLETEEKFSFPTLMQRAVLQMLFICGYVAFFSVAAALLAPFLPSAFLKGLLYSFLEVGSAASYLSGAFSSSVAAFLPLLSFAISFSGLSVWLQSSDHVRTTDLSEALYLPSKIIQGVLSFLLCVIFLDIGKNLC